MAEVEKIWIVYDLDNSGNLNYNEFIKYLNENSVGPVKLDIGLLQ